jgi:hypothetical protein
MSGVSWFSFAHFRICAFAHLRPKKGLLPTIGTLNLHKSSGLFFPKPRPRSGKKPLTSKPAPQWLVGLHVNHCSQRSSKHDKVCV